MGKICRLAQTPRIRTYTNVLTGEGLSIFLIEETQSKTKSYTTSPPPLECLQWKRLARASVAEDAEHMGLSDFAGGRVNREPLRNAVLRSITYPVIRSCNSSVFTHGKLKTRPQEDVYKNILRSRKLTTKPVPINTEMDKHIVEAEVTALSSGRQHTV